MPPGLDQPCPAGPAVAVPGRGGPETPNGVRARTGPQPLTNSARVGRARRSGMSRKPGDRTGRAVAPGQRTPPGRYVPLPVTAKLTAKPPDYGGRRWTSMDPRTPPKLHRFSIIGTDVRITRAPLRPTGLPSNPQIRSCRQKPNDLESPSTLHRPRRTAARRGGSQDAQA